MISKIRFRTLLTAIMVALIMTVMCATILISNSKYKRALIEEASSSRKDVLLQVSNEVRRVYESALIISNLYFYSDEIDTIMETNPKYLTDDKIQEYNINLKLMINSYRNLLANFNISYYFILSCDNGYNYLSRPQYTPAYHFDKYQKEPFYENMLKNGTHLTISGPYTDQLSETESETVVVFGRMLYNWARKKDGFLIVNIPESNIRELYEGISQNSRIFVLDQGGTIVSTNQTALLGQNYRALFGSPHTPHTDSDGFDYLVTSYEIPDMELMLVEQLSYDIILDPIDRITRNIILICLLILAVFIAVAVLLAYVMTSGLRALAGKLAEVGDGGLGTDFNITGWYEITQISDVCNQMIRRIRSLIEDIRKKEEQKKEAEINFLQAQINPHFIYNTIFSASCMIQTGEAGKASAMLVEFINLLRWTFKTKSSLVTLEDIVVHLNHYIQIMQYRFSDSFQVVYEIADDTRKARMINMLIQPIIENAIFHGIEPCDHPCTLIISSAIEGERLVIRVKDDGVGMNQDELEHYIKSLDKPESLHGMHNVLQRLRAAFDQEFSLSVQSEEGKGTCVAIAFPLIY